MAGIVKDATGKWRIDPHFLTPERRAIMDRLEKQHRVDRDDRESR